MLHGAAWGTTTTRGNTYPTNNNIKTKNPIKITNNNTKTTAKINNIHHFKTNKPDTVHPTFIQEDNDSDETTNVNGDETTVVPLDDEIAFFTDPQDVPGTTTEISITNLSMPTHYACYGQEGFQLLQEQLFPIIEQWVLAHPDDQ